MQYVDYVYMYVCVHQKDSVFNNFSVMDIQRTFSVRLVAFMKINQQSFPVTRRLSSLHLPLQYFLLLMLYF